jgi:hypothetical protein
VVYFRCDDHVEIAPVEKPVAVEIGSRKPEILDRHRVVGRTRRRYGSRRGRAAHGVGDVAVHLDIDHRKSGRELVAEIHADFLQLVAELFAVEHFRFAFRAEAQTVFDVFAAYLLADLLEERFDALAFPNGIVPVEFEERAVNRRALGGGGCDAEGGKRQPSRHQPARSARGGGCGFHDRLHDIGCGAFRGGAV